jgi:hypothetical protein
MKTHSLFSLTLLLTICLIIYLPEIVRGEAPEAVQGLISTSHNEDVPSNTTTIDMVWTVPENYTGYYYTIFTEASEYTQYTFDEDSAEGLLQIEDGFASFYHSGDDTSYYFHIAPVWTNEDEDEEYGPTSSFGPIIIDTTAPTGSVTISPKPSTTSNVTLELTTDDAVKMLVSNIGPGEGSEIDFVTSMPWELEDGEGTKWVYVQLRDSAGNIKNLSDSVTVNDNTSPEAGTNSQQYSGDATAISVGLSITDAEGGLLTVTSTSDCLTLVSAEIYSITGIGWSANGNVYSVTATAGETIPLTLTLEGMSVTSLTPSTITLTVADANNLSTTHILNVYKKGDVDGDGIVELEDVEKAFYFLVGLNSPSDLESYIINTVNDGEIISQEDFQTIFDLYIGL